MRICEWAKQISVSEFFFSLRSKEHKSNRDRVCVCDDALNFVCWTKNWEPRECETAKPRYNLWLKSFSLLINFAASVCALRCVFTWVRFYCEFSRRILWRSLFSSRKWEFISFHFLFGWKMKLHKLKRRKVQKLNCSNFWHSRIAQRNN